MIDEVLKDLGRCVEFGKTDRNSPYPPDLKGQDGADELAKITLETLRIIHQKLGHNITMGAGNILFGLPDRKSLNAAFMALSIFNGLTCPIANPEKITADVRATDLVLGRDEFALRFIEYFQSHQ
ncbi:MAG: hypothetical protein MUC93_11290 [Bacteroidales bacterium]|jgi:5-methyltetrahydrofolate--homocysteine methyltransferase|nr:hypothetical protein [Bacteroidales bacterium]